MKSRNWSRTSRDVSLADKKHDAMTHGAMIIADLRQKKTRTEDGGNVPFKNGELQLFWRDRVVEAFLTGRAL